MDNCGSSGVNKCDESFKYRVEGKSGASSRGTGIMVKGDNSGAFVFLRERSNSWTTGRRPKAKAFAKN
ncbi:hypothetical protein DICVIV_13903, partial [Dictyocaulus viviparus]